MRRSRPFGAVLAAAVALAVFAVHGPAAADPDDLPGTYRNPVMDNVAEAFSDPSIVRGKDGYWYAYATQTQMFKDNNSGVWDDQYFMPITRSADLVNWEYVGEVFGRDNHPQWVQFEGTYYWAPDIRYINGVYFLYYSISGNNNQAIGLATATTPQGPWTDIGHPVVDRNDGVYEIDPAVFVDDDGQMYLYYGSFRDAGIVVVRLSADGTTATGPSTRVVGSARGEAPYVVKRDGWYYLFYSGMGCCANEKGAYPVFVGRSRSPLGPFLDAEGVDLNALHPGGTIVNSPNGNRWVATGHSANVVDKAGQDWILTNGFDRNKTDWGGRPAVMDRLDWIDGWPTVRAGAWTSDERLTAPVGKWLLGSRFDDGIKDFVPSGARSWVIDDDPQSAQFVRSNSNGRSPAFLLPKKSVAADARLEADLRLRQGTAPDGGRVGLVLAYLDHRNHVVAWIEPRQRLVIEVTKDGQTTKAASADLYRGIDLTTWHAVTAEIRGGAAHVQLSSDMLGIPLAELTVAVPDGWRRGGVASRRGAGQADNVGITKLYTPVTERVPDPEVGELLPEYSEEFDDDDLDGWSWFGPADGWVEDGEYVWPTQDAGFNGDPVMASALLRDPPQGTYTVETKLHLPITDAPDSARGRQAGLIAFQSPEDSIHLAPSRTGQSRQTLLWIGRDRDSWPEMQMGPSADTLWLRLRHTIHPGTGEHLFQVATSRDGGHYIWGGVWHLPAGADPQIGLVSLGGEGLTATFDYVRFYG